MTTDRPQPPADAPSSDEDIPVPLGEVLEFLRLIWALDHRIQQASKRMERSIGLSGPQRIVLRIVGRIPGITAGRSAGILHIHPGTLPSLLGRLERRRLVRRRVDAGDRRRVLVELTPSGKRLDVEAPGTVESAVCAALAAMRPEDVDGARRVISAI